MTEPAVHAHPLSRRIAHVLALQPDSPALEFDEHWYSWGRIGGLAQRIGAVLEPDVEARSVGILLRNRPEHVAALMAVLQSGGTVVVINPSRGDDRTRDDIAALRLPVLIGAPGDLDSLVTPGAETTVVSIPGPDALPEIRVTATTNTEAARPGAAVRMLTSGTTGPPKRVDITYDMLARSVMGTDPAAAPAQPRKGVAIVNAPLVHIGGVFRVLQCVTQARPFVLLPRFELKPWVRAVRAHRPGAVSLVPAALRMVLHSELRREDLAGIRVVTSGTAPLSADDADAFSEKFGIPVLTSYAATEFGGGVAGWTLPDHERYWTAKRGSVGRASGGARLRVVDEHGAVLGSGEPGILEVIPGQLGPGADWIHTTDLARIDADGFLWILGRADQAIIRGGFKIMPDDVRSALESHPAVRGAAVVGRPDPRLGETPVALVELREGTTASDGELTDHLRTRLARYEIPTELAVVHTIPRTPSGKPDLRAVRRHFEEVAATANAQIHPDSDEAARPESGEPRNPTGDEPADITGVPREPAVPADDNILVGVLRKQANERGEHPLLVCDQERISYADAESRSARLARALIALGAGKGTHIGLLYPNGADFVVGAFAAARIGAVVVPFSTFSTPRELGTQLVGSDIRILLATAGYRTHDYVARLSELLPGAFDSDAARAADRVLCPAAPQLRHIAIDYAPAHPRTHVSAATRPALPDGPEPRNGRIGLSGTGRRIRDIGELDPLADIVGEELLAAMEREVDAADPLAIIHTSGSTSAPKGVVLTHGGLLGHQRNLNEIRRLTPGDRLFCNSPFYWIGGFGYALLASVLAGSTLICSNATDASATLDLLEAEKPTVTNGFAAGVAHLARHPSFAGRDLSSMRRGNLYAIMPADARPADPELRHNMLGMTEAGSVVLLSGDDSDQPEYRRGSFGRPAPGFDTRIVDPDTGADTAIGEIGELYIRGPYVMQGYYRRGREECFDADGWFHTGDLVRADDEGFVYFLGRRGARIKTAGANVSPAEVEKAITKITGATAYVLGLPDPERGQIVAAVIVTSDATLDETALRERLRQELSAYKVPRLFAALRPADVPLLAGGKVDSRQLGKIFHA
ncbi:AMP-binding protein [Nocardia sp. NPDC024068]|uniref:class I adenylate-forming enzyme family protein n=1 Tax=Nocardia sp. NPDC024068 TaxID=3157197 RepID=UPI0033E9A9DF